MNLAPKPFCTFNLRVERPSFKRTSIIMFAAPPSDHCFPLTSAEQNIFSLLNKLDINFYIAGGWVRDKLLGRNSHDIDLVFWSHHSAMEVAEMLKNLQEDIGIGQSRRPNLCHLGVNG